MRSTVSTMIRIVPALCRIGFLAAIYHWHGGTIMLLVATGMYLEFMIWTPHDDES